MSDSENRFDPNQVVVRGSSGKHNEDRGRQLQAVEAYLAEHDKPEDHKLSPDEEARLAEFVEAKRFSSTITDTREQHENDSVLGLKVLDWVNGNDLTFGPSDLEVDKNGANNVDYIRALVKRRRQEAALKAGLL